jgi:hypothetical protein
LWRHTTGQSTAADAIVNDTTVNDAPAGEVTVNVTVDPIPVSTRGSQDGTG